MARTPYNDPEAEKQYQDNSVENRNTQMAGSVSNWPYSAKDVQDNKAASDAIRPLQINPSPATVIQFPGGKKPK